MRILMFYHSVVSDWNHGNAHFLRGVATELLALGHDVVIYEPKNGWSFQNLINEEGSAPLQDFEKIYPHLVSMKYEVDYEFLEKAVEGADLVLVHEWNDAELIRRLGRLREQANFRLLFHDTHHRLVSDRDNITRLELGRFDGVLAFGGSLAEMYRELGVVERVWTWHEAADTRIFYPRTGSAKGDLVWVGNWGDEERTSEIQEYICGPVASLGLRADLYGVRYPYFARVILQQHGIAYRGWLPNFRVPEIFARFKVTVHVPRRPYVKLLPGVPTIRVFEALACGIPLVSAPWDDTEALFTPGRDYLVANDKKSMERHLRAVVHDTDLARELAEFGRRTVQARHSCAHRVQELLRIYSRIAPNRNEIAA